MEGTRAGPTAAVERAVLL